MQQERVGFPRWSCWKSSFNSQRAKNIPAQRAVQLHATTFIPHMRPIQTAELQKTYFFWH